MSSNSKCDKLRNPFIKDSSNEIYSISDNIIEEIRESYTLKDPKSGKKDENENKVKKLRIFKKNILPKIMATFKSKFYNFNSSNCHAMELLVLSNNFKQFNDFYLNREYFPYLDGINELIENKNSVIESSQQDVIDNLYKEIENAEQIYFKNNKIYKENIIKFIATVALQYFGEFRTYADFETTKSIVELNTLKSYQTFLTKNVATLLKNKKNNAEVQKEINKAFNSIINVFPSSIYEYLPRELNDIIEEEMNPQTKEMEYKININSDKKEKMDDTIKDLSNNITYYSKSFTDKIKNEEINYRNIIAKFNEIIKIEQKEEVLFTDLQSTRNQLNTKIKEIGKGIQDKKYSLLKNEFDTAYKNYTTLICNKINLYKELKNLIISDDKKNSNKKENKNSNKKENGNSNKKENENSNKKPNKKSYEPNKVIQFERFKLEFIFKQIFENGLGSNNQDKKIECNNTNYDILDKDYRSTVFNYLYKEINKGKDDIILESLRNQDKRNIYEFTLYMNDIFEYHVSFFQSEIDNYNAIKQKVETELNIIKTMEENAKTQLQEKQTYLTSLTADIRDFEKKKTDLQSNMDKKETNIKKDLLSTTVASAFGSITFDSLFTIDYDKIEEAQQKYISKVHNKTTFQDIINNIIQSINKLSYVNNEEFKTLFNRIVALIKYDSHKISSSQLDLSSFQTKMDNKLKSYLEKKNSGTYGNSDKITSQDIFKKLIQNAITFIENNKTEYREIYNKDIEEFLKNDSGFKKANDALMTIMSSYRSYQDDNRKLKEYDEKLYALKSEEKEIKEGPEEFTKQYNAKNTYNKRVDEYLKQLNKILDNKKKSNDVLRGLIGTDAFKSSMELMYNALISRYKNVYDLIKRNNIRSEVYNLFSNDFLYKITKTLHDLISPHIETVDRVTQQKANSYIPPESIVEVAKSYQLYVNERLEDFPKMIEKDDGIMKFKRYQLQSMSNVLKGQKIGSYYIKPDSNMKEFVKKIKNEDINDITGLVKKLYNKDLSINQINKEKLGKYMRNYANIEKSLKMTGGNTNKINQIINMPKENNEKYFIKKIYKILLADNTNTSKDFVEKLRNIEYKMLMAAKAKLRSFTYLYKDGGKGKDKINNHFVLLYNMTKICLDDFDTILTNIFKRGKATTQRINLLMIAKYIYMEVIMIYTLSYFC